MKKWKKQVFATFSKFCCSYFLKPYLFTPLPPNLKTSKVSKHNKIRKLAFKTPIAISHRLSNTLAAYVYAVGKN